MTRALPIEQRWIALLRARGTLLGAVVLGGLGLSSLTASGVGTEPQPDSVFQVILYAAVLPSLILGQGMISGDLRSGVALLWLQKPVGPVRFFLRRGCEVTALSVAVALAVPSLWFALREILRTNDVKPLPRPLRHAWTVFFVVLIAL